MKNIVQKANHFQVLHRQQGAFVIPNPWDQGTARLLATLGFEALATSSAAYAFSSGKRDGDVSRDAMMAHVASIVSATDLPVSADLQNGFGDDPDTTAETVRIAASVGAVGGSIEDATGREEDPLYSKAHAAERVRAAAEAARAQPHPFLLTARAENYLYQRPDLKDTIERLQLFQEAGADVLYAPGLRTLDEITSVVRSVDRPVNILLGLPNVSINLAQLSAAGVKRVSVGSALCRVALASFLHAAHEMRSNGTFDFATRAINYADLNTLLSAQQSEDPLGQPVTDNVST